MTKLTKKMAEALGREGYPACKEALEKEQVKPDEAAGDSSRSVGSA